TISPTFQLQDGTNDLGYVSFHLSLGALATISTEDFDSVSAPALPGGWATSASSGAVAWVTSTSQAQSPPNSAFTPDVATSGVNELVSPPFPVPSAGAQFTFRHNYTTETGYDGSVLEIKIGEGAYVDILAAGGSFVVGGYNGTLNSGTPNPLTGRAGWTGSSGGFITTIVTLPATAVGQIVQFRWRFGTDASVSATGWYVDTVSLSAPTCCGDASAPFAVFTASPLSGAAPLLVGFTDSSIGTITNRFWDFGNGVTTNTTETSVLFTYTAAGTFHVSLTAQGTYGDSTVIRSNYITATNAVAVLATNGISLVSENCVNGGVDPGETITLSLGLKNLGTADTTNLVATLLAGGGVTAPSGPQNYGAIAAAGGTANQAFTFTAGGSCGDNL
ncbi:MAG TPA: PKD domain-containing protein, partial [Pirellulaceae bacterium]